MSNSIEKLIATNPFGLSQEEKTPIFRAAMKEAFAHHITHNPLFEKYCMKKGLDLSYFPDDMADLPYIPVNLFKTKILSSIAKEKVKKTVKSSATTGNPSTIIVDQITSNRQTIVSSKVIKAFIGDHRRPFLILDEDPTTNRNSEINARIAATTGFIIFSNENQYLLHKKNGDLSLEYEKIIDILGKIEESQEDVTIFGFTYILYHYVIRVLKERGHTFKLSPNTNIVHIGGWKKLDNQKVNKSDFCEDIKTVLSVSSNNIIDFYGFTEQMGLVYGSRGLEPKSIHNYADIIIRDIQSLEPVEIGKEGFIQILTPVPNSYPGVSVLTEDIGRIVDKGLNLEGIPNKRFEIIGRAKKAEVRGCGDIMAEYVT